MTRSQLATTSSAVMGLPSLNVMPGRSVKVSRCPSSDTSQCSASAGWTRASEIERREALPDLGQDGCRLGIAHACRIPADRRRPGHHQVHAVGPCGRQDGGWMGRHGQHREQPTPIISATSTTGPTTAATERRWRRAVGGGDGIRPAGVSGPASLPVGSSCMRASLLPMAVPRPPRGRATAGPHPTRPWPHRTAIVAWTPMQAAWCGASSADRRPTRPQEVQAGHAYPYHVCRGWTGVRATSTRPEAAHGGRDRSCHDTR